MTGSLRLFVAPALAVAVAVAASAVIDRVLAGTDVIAALLAHRGGVVALGLLARLGLRVFLAFGVPAWLLYLSGCTAVERLRSQRRAG